MNMNCTTPAPVPSNHSNALAAPCGGRRSNLFKATALSAFIALSLPGQVVVSNLTETQGGTETVSSFNTVAAAFTTDDSAVGWTLDSVTLLMATATSSTGSGFFTQIWSESGGSPGTALGTLSGNDFPLSAGSYAYTASGISLAPNTTYYVVTGVSSGSGEFNWQLTPSPNQTGSWSIGNLLYYTSATLWSAVSSNGVPMFSVSASAVPEPAAVGVGIGGLVLAGVLWLRVRKRATVSSPVA